jgi:hypothetical protein
MALWPKITSVTFEAHLSGHVRFASGIDSISNFDSAKSKSVDDAYEAIEDGKILRLGITMPQFHPREAGVDAPELCREILVQVGSYSSTVPESR